MEKSKLLNKLSPEKALLSAIHSLRMEGLEPSQEAIEDGKLLLEGKVTADELVEKYKNKYGKGRDDNEKSVSR